MPDIFINPHFDANTLAQTRFTNSDENPLAFHRTFADYAPTPLHDVPVLAQKLGVGRLLIKDESSRMGLPAYKMLGASWATFRALLDWLGEGVPARDIDEIDSVGALKLVLHSGDHPLPTLTAATDGNHGRAVARMAKLLGIPARIYVPHDMAQARREAIADEGAQIVVVNGTYDEAVVLSAEEAGDNALVISDTSWEGYETTPRRVIEGYGTIFAEVDAQLDTDTMPLPAPDVVFAQIGVGALAAAVVNHYVPKSARVIGVEPVNAACVLAALRADQVIQIPLEQSTIMAGLVSGTASMLAFPVMKYGLAGLAAVEDRYAEEAMRLLAGVDIVAGETGGAGLAGLLALRDQDAYAALGIDTHTTVMVIITESATDPENYRKIVGANY